MSFIDQPGGTSENVVPVTRLELILINGGFPAESLRKILYPVMEEQGAVQLRLTCCELAVHSNPKGGRQFP